jgi:glycosyltransferase involved in cell wall biosynthesis
MHIGVNARRLAGQRFGIGRYIEYMLKYWDRQLAPHDQLSVFVREPFEPTDLGLSPRVRSRLLSPALTGISWENAVLPRHLESIDVLFCPSYTAPLTIRMPTVVVIHSANEAQPGLQSWWDNQTYSRLYRLSARRADRVIVPSELTGDSVRTIYGVPAARVDVVPLGVDLETFRPTSNRTDDRSVRRRYLGRDVPFVLFVGKMSRRRNIDVLVKAFAEFKRRSGLPHHLLLLGAAPKDFQLERMIAELGLDGIVVRDDGRISSHAELVPIYNAADLFVHPTTYDSSSLPVLEAFACGVPVVSGRTGGLGELVDGCAYVVDIPTVDSVAEALSAMLTNETIRTQLRQRAFERVRDRSWEVVSRKTLAAVARVVEEHRAAETRAPSRGTIARDA